MTTDRTPSDRTPSDRTGLDHDDATARTTSPDAVLEVPPTPSEAAAVFGDRLPTAEAYVALLADTGIRHGLIGPREAPRLWDRHVLNCAVFTSAFAPDSAVADIGSGAGLPGLVIAIARPDLRVTLVEPLHRRVVWLLSSVETLGLENVEVHEGRAESLWNERTFPAVTARAVARIGKLAGWCLPLLEPQGRLVAMKGSSAATELDEDAEVLRRAGAVGWSVTTHGVGVVEPPTTVVTVEVGPDGAPGPAGRAGGRRRTSGHGRSGSRGARRA